MRGVAKIQSRAKAAITGARRPLRAAHSRSSRISPTGNTSKGRILLSRNMTATCRETYATISATDHDTTSRTSQKAHRNEITPTTCTTRKCILPLRYRGLSRTKRQFHKNYIYGNQSQPTWLRKQTAIAREDSLSRGTGFHGKIKDRDSNPICLRARITPISQQNPQISKPPCQGQHR